MKGAQSNLPAANQLARNLSRRHFFGTAAAALGAGLLASPGLAWAHSLAQGTTPSLAFPLASQRYKVAVVNLIILKRQKLGAFPLAKEIGADGLEVDMGGLGNRDTFDNKLADPKIRQQFLDKARELNLEICSLAMTGFYAQSFATRPTYQQMVQD